MTARLQKLSLLLVSVIVLSSGVLLPSLPEITQEYSKINSTLVELLSTLPALFTMLTVSFSPHLAEKLGYKQTVQLGLVITLVSGFAPMLTSSFIWLFISRVTFGIGIGLFNPLLFSFSSHLYKGNELSSMIGFQSAFEGIGGIVTSLLVAQLIAGGWRQTLWVYLIILPVLLLFSFFVPNIGSPRTVEARQHTKIKIDKAFLLLIVLLMILITVYMSVSVKLTALLLEGRFGTAKDASLALALMGFGAMSAGLLFGKSIQLFKQWLLPVALTGMGVSLLCLGLTRNLSLVLLSNIAIGLAFRSFVPYLMNLANQVSDGSGERRTALLLMGFNIGSAFAPVSIKVLQNMLHLKEVKSIYLVEGLFLCFLAIGSFALMVIKNQKNRK
ncbi:MFS transporter [Streptococcus ovuberis]|uniref:MFS transporter n=1 Tax=Streptococcus ovuberis TaxID=1936207 RepID=A0A7X6S1I4_9STRE|nr:MFS transporter [Streptococcus ovuberis]NKZ20206.1 MFS transporter [Streptococcus ovuberis]